MPRFQRLARFAQAVVLSSSTLLAPRLALAANGGRSAAEWERQKQQMDSAEEARYAIEDAIDKHDLEGAQKSVLVLTSVCNEQKAFWKRRSVPEATALANSSAAAAAKLQRLVRAQKFAEAKVTLSELNTACRQCHDLHLEKSVPH